VPEDGFRPQGINLTASLQARLPGTLPAPPPPSVGVGGWLGGEGVSERARRNIVCINCARWSPHMVTDTAQPFLEKKESAVGLKSALTFLKKA
jgi:hypothetical protein